MVNSCCLKRLCLVHVIFASLLSTLTWLCPSLVLAFDNGSPPKLLLISFDGFGWNFLSKLPRSKLPNFHSMMQKGVHVKWVENVFPTVTQPNHMSLISGLYPESHGIVHNLFFDPVLNATFPSEGGLKEDDSKWVDMGAEPVWVTNSKAGEGRRSGTIYWPCTDAKIKNRLPDESKRGGWTVNETVVSPHRRIDLAFDWFTGNSVNPVNFIAVYMGNVDHISHVHGIESPELLEAIVSRDEIINYLLTKITEKKLEEKLNVIVTADHGHFPIYPELMINIDLLVEPSCYKAYPPLGENEGVVVHLWPEEGCYEKLVKGLEGMHPRLHVATGSKDEDLLELHYTRNRRIPPIVLYAEPGWVIGTNATSFQRGKGQHGWDPRYSPYMYPFFLAMGPAFKKGLHNAKPFHIVDIYSLMCHILGLKPAPNNGSLSNTAHILLDITLSNSLNYVGVAVAVTIIIIVVVVVIVIIGYVRKNKKVTASYRRTFAESNTSGNLMSDGAAFSDEEL